MQKDCRSVTKNPSCQVNDSCSKKCKNDKMTFSEKENKNIYCLNYYRLLNNSELNIC